MTGLTRKPRIGEKITYKGEPYGEVVSVSDDNLCWVRKPARGKMTEVDTVFIWRFVDYRMDPHGWTFNEMFGHEGSEA